MAHSKKTISSGAVASKTETRGLHFASHQCDQMLKEKVAQVFKKLPKK